VTAPASRRTDRLSVAAKRTLDPSSLVGSFFHSDHKRGWQGCVVAEPSPGVYLVETFEWLAGSSTSQHLIPLADMKDWTFYDDADWLRNNYDNHIQRHWDYLRKQDGENAEAVAE
jgi:hypothetical protein